MKRFFREAETRKQKLISGPSCIKSIGLSSRPAINAIRAKNRERIDVILYATLCPFYEKPGIVSADYDRFSDVPDRFQQKAAASLQVIGFLRSMFQFRITFVLADQGVLLSDRYSGNLAEDLADTKDIYASFFASQLEEPFDMSSFSELGVTLPDACNTDDVYTINDCLAVLEQYGIPPDSCRNQVDIMIRGFGGNAAVAYALISCYLEESKQASDIMRGDMLLNVEACQPLNSLYKMGPGRIDQGTCFARVDIGY